MKIGNPCACVTVNCKLCKTAISLYCLYKRVYCKRNVNKSNHPIQNPLLFVTEHRIRDNILWPRTNVVPIREGDFGSTALTLSRKVATICTTRFKAKITYILSTEYTYVFHVILKIKSNYFPEEFWSLYWDATCFLWGTNSSVIPYTLRKNFRVATNVRVRVLNCLLSRIQFPSGRSCVRPSW
jgi:hypothetical protein